MPVTFRFTNKWYPFSLLTFFVLELSIGAIVVLRIALVPSEGSLSIASLLYFLNLTLMLLVFNMIRTQKGSIDYALYVLSGLILFAGGAGLVLMGIIHMVGLHDFTLWATIPSILAVLTGLGIMMPIENSLDICHEGVR